MSGLCAPVPQPCLCIVKIPVRQQRRRLVIVFPGYRRAWQIKAASGRETERDIAALFCSYGSRSFLTAEPQLMTGNVDEWHVPIDTFRLMHASTPLIITQSTVHQQFLHVCGAIGRFLCALLTNAPCFTDTLGY